jgi:hypothetical protein
MKKKYMFLVSSAVAVFITVVIIFAVVLPMSPNNSHPAEITIIPIGMIDAEDVTLIPDLTVEEAKSMMALQSVINRKITK